MKRKNRTVKPPRKKTTFLKNWKFLRLSLSAILVMALIFIFYCFLIIDDIPSLEELENPNQNLKTVLLAKNGDIIDEIYIENRTKVSYDQLPSFLIDALLATEDIRFQEHSGIDFFGLVRAAVKSSIYYLSFKQIGRREGASTITMQAAGNLFVGRDISVKRKILEILTSFQLERTYSKSEIIEIYFNTMDFNNNSYGIYAAAKTYFNKNVSELDAAESATLVGLLKGTTRYNPKQNPELSLQRRNVVLAQMLKYNKLNQSQYDEAIKQPINVIEESEKKSLPHFREQLTKELTELGKTLGFDPRTDGLQVFTTLDPDVQESMDSAIVNHIADIEKANLNRAETQALRNQYLKNRTYGSVEDAELAFKENNLIQYGFIVLDQKTGEVLGHIGGRKNTAYDHVFQAQRQPGSTNKPFVYALAIDNDWTPASQILDAPYIAFQEDGKEYRVINWDDSYEGLITLRRALMKSKNVATLRLQDEIGGPANVRQLMKSMQIQSEIRPYTSLALGTSEVKPIEMASAYGAFANNGVWVETHTINKILDKNGELIYSNPIVKKVVLNENTAYIISRMMESGVNEIGGTSHAIRRFVRPEIHVAGKTGTTQDFIDIWSIAFTPRFTVCLWMGMDNPKHRMNLYSSAAVPVVGEFIKRVYDKKSNEWFVEDFIQPDGVVKADICLIDGVAKLAGDICPEKYTEYFRKGLEPKDFVTVEDLKKMTKKKIEF